MEAAYHFHDGLFPGNAAYELCDTDAQLCGRRGVVDGRPPRVEITRRSLIIRVTLIVRRTVSMSVVIVF